MPARWDWFVQHGTDRCVESTKEEFEIWRTFDFNQHFKLRNFGISFFLCLMLQKIGEDGHVVLDVVTEIHCDRHTFVVVFGGLEI